VSARLAGVACAILACVGLAQAAERAAEPDDYRGENYRSPVPATLKGARVLTTAEAESLWRGRVAAFVDVLPRPPKPANLPAGTVWHDKPRFNIPGSIWLPDTGYGTLAPSTEAYLRDGLNQVSGGDPAKPLVFYCLAECWMSWNAAKRALSYGYSNVAWYPDGTEAWQAANLPVVEAQPAPGVQEKAPAPR
jgi:PQQ-dependent catabolism-associated CXXCW motif protein